MTDDPPDLAAQVTARLSAADGLMAQIGAELTRRAATGAECDLGLARPLMLLLELRRGLDELAAEIRRIAAAHVRWLEEIAKIRERVERLAVDLAALARDAEGRVIR